MDKRVSTIKNTTIKGKTHPPLADRKDSITKSITQDSVKEEKFQSIKKAAASENVKQRLGFDFTLSKRGISPLSDRSRAIQDLTSQAVVASTIKDVPIQRDDPGSDTKKDMDQLKKIANMRSSAVSASESKDTPIKVPKEKCENSVSSPVQSRHEKRIQRLADGKARRKGQMETPGTAMVVKQCLQCQMLYLNMHECS